MKVVDNISGTAQADRMRSDPHDAVAHVAGGMLTLGLIVASSVQAAQARLRARREAEWTAYHSECARQTKSAQADAKAALWLMLAERADELAGG